jgi:hypothetical protein
MRRKIVRPRGFDTVRQCYDNVKFAGLGVNQSLKLME